MSEWISVKPGCQLPLKGQRVIAMVGYEPHEAFYQRGAFWWPNHDSMVLPTHWTPMPDPPPRPASKDEALRFAASRIEALIGEVQSCGNSMLYRDIGPEVRARIAADQALAKIREALNG